jgi:PAS domain S-box-containing protein
LLHVLHLSDVAIIVVDENLFIRIANRGAGTIFGYHPGELIGVSLDVLLPERFIEAHRQHVRNYHAESGSFRKMGDHSEVYGRRKDGSEFPAAASISRSTHAGRTTFAVILREITPHIDEGGHYPALMRERARTTVLSELIDDIAHDLKTPLSVIRANIYLMQHAQHLEDHERRLNAIAAAAYQMEHLTSSLTRVSHLEHGRETDFAPVNINELIFALANHFSARAEEADIELFTDLGHNLPQLMGLVNELHRALGNLLENAITHTDAGGSISMTSRSHKGGVKVVIEDTGAGIDADALPHIFERFYRSGRAEEEGSGLGLSIVKKIIEMHAGHISVESTPGVGTSFTIWLPVGASQQTE